MKVLQYAYYISIPGDDAFSRQITGYGYMVRDIADYLSRLDVKIDLLTAIGITREKKFNNINILRRTWLNIIVHIKLHDLLHGIKTIIKNAIPLKNAVKVLLYYSSTGYFEKIIRTNNYDLVHIHGIGYYSLPIIKCCEKNKIKFLVTLHGLNSFNDIISSSPDEKQIERDFLQKAADADLPVTIISTGIRNRILKFLNIAETNTFYVIPNGCHVNIKDNSQTTNIKIIHKIDSNKEIMLCVGNIYPNKNQAQVIRAYNLLPEQIKQKLVVLFLGNDCTSGETGNVIRENNLQDQLILCGSIDRGQINSYYSQADYTILASITEGFGLSIIEGFFYGLPNITFRDLDAVPDLYDEKAMFLVDNRTDEALANGIIQMMSMSWDREYIKKQAQKYSLEAMAEKYFSFFKKIV
jgi:glycosyltransferase involved in cell wall biosynthesis